MSRSISYKRYRVIAMPHETGSPRMAKPKAIWLGGDRSHAGKATASISVNVNRTAAYANQLSCWRSAAWARRNRMNTETVVAMTASPVTTENARNSADDSRSPLDNPSTPMGLGTRRPDASSVGPSEDISVTVATATTLTHSSGRHLGDGSPEGNRSRVNRLDMANSGYQNHSCVQAASRAREG